MAVFGVDIGSIQPQQIERLYASFREATSIPTDSMLHAQEPLARLTESVAATRAHFTRLTDQLKSWHQQMAGTFQHIAHVNEQMIDSFVSAARWNEEMAEILAPSARIAEALGSVARWNEETTETFACWKKQLAQILAPVAPWSEHLAEALEPFRQEQRVAQIILELGLLPHSEMIEAVANMELPEGKTSEVSEQIAMDFWAKKRPQLELSLDECLGDQKIFISFSELLRAHDTGLYQLTMSGASSVIERAVRLAQRQGRKANKPIRWLDADLRELPCTHVRSWRVLSIVMEQTFAQCWTDAEADDIQYPNRHACAHGLGARISNVVDSLNAVMIAHFVITAALAFDKHTRASLH